MKKFYFIILSTLLSYSCSDEAYFIERDTSKFSDEIEIYQPTPHDFPSLQEIMENNKVQEKLYNAWQEMMALAGQYGRKELGFYIYYNKSNNSFYFGDTKYGEYTPYQVGYAASVDLGKPENNLTVCAFFHCHTPISYYPVYGMERPIGPSEADKAFALNNDLPGMLYEIDCGGDVLYSWIPREELSWRPCPFGPERRSTIYY